MEYGFHIYDEKSTIPFSVPDGQIRKNVDPKNQENNNGFANPKQRFKRRWCVCCVAFEAKQKQLFKK